ncbi:TPR domain protein [Penicillium angulare]|uniref:TPR domain protein n=1 Tax=Penicillium angulare TaxID=116970 RepID=A0A9W9FVT8_9EURO|nr:TPR domain protein [Penicillium angulare]
MSLVAEDLVPRCPKGEYYVMGFFSRKVSTKSEAAQVWFDRGLIWCYSFNHEEAYRCFEQAICHDRNFPMAYWGLAYAKGPNYNKAWRLFDQLDLRITMKVCYQAIAHATKLLATEPVTPIERALIVAMQARYPFDHPAEDYDPINHAYDQAMQRVHDQFPQDLDAMALYVDAKMHIAQRKMFHIKNGLPIEGTPVYDIIELFDEGLQHPDADHHPGLLHFSIHFWEMSATPHKALLSADKLGPLVPDAGHLHHMPSHIYVLVGEYRRSVQANTAAVKADNKYLAQNGAANIYSFYRLHNYHSLVYAAMLSGQSKVALDTLDPMESSLTDEVLRVESPPLADWLEFFKAVRVHVYIRFGLWEEIKALPIPEDKDLHCTTTAMTYYGKGIAYAATGDVDEANNQRELYLQAAKNVPESRKDYPNRIVDVLKVATSMLNGEIEYRRGNFTEAFEHLREAIKHDDALMYTEPWGWMLPTRHAYAALSLEQGHVEEAARIYAEDLGLDPKLTRAHQHPHCVWSLHGYHECLLQLGRHDEALIIKQQLDSALMIADVDIKSSCFCRLGVDTVRAPKCCS